MASASGRGRGQAGRRAPGAREPTASTSGASAWPCADRLRLERPAAASWRVVGSTWPRALAARLVARGACAALPAPGACA